MAAVRCQPEGEVKPLLFSHTETELLRGRNQPVDQVTAAALLKYGQTVHDPCTILRNQAHYTFSTIFSILCRVINVVLG